MQPISLFQVFQRFPVLLPGVLVAGAVLTGPPSALNINSFYSHNSSADPAVEGAIQLPMLRSAWAQEVATAQVTAVIGNVTVQRPGTNPVPLQIGGSLSIGDIISTGTDGKATILFVDGSLVRVNVNTTLELTPPTPDSRGNRSLIRVAQGQVFADLRPGWSVQTPSATAAGRGATLDLIASPTGSVTLTALEGEVDFFNAYGAVVVVDGQQSVAQPGAAPTKPIALANTGLIVEWTLDLAQARTPREKYFRFASPRDPQLRQLLSVGVGPTVPPAARQNFGDLLFDAGRFAEALAAYDAVIAALPVGTEQDNARWRRAYTLLEMGRVDEAQKAFEALTSGTLATPARLGLAWTLLERDRPAEALPVANAVLASPGELAGEARVISGLAQLRQGNLAEARSLFEQAQNEPPVALQAQAQAHLALTLLSSGDVEGADKASALAAEKAPESALAQGVRAQVLFFAGQGAAASAVAKRAVALDPESVPAQVALAQANLVEGDVEGAQRAATRAVALDPKSVTALYLRGVAEGSGRDYGRAARSLRRALQLAPDFAPATAALARVYVRQGRGEEAAKVLTDYQAQRKAAGAPTSDVVLSALGEVFYETGRYAEGIATYEEAVRVQPNNAVAWGGLARLALDANRLNQSIRAGQKAVALAPQVAQFHANLALAYERARFAAQSERSYRRALELDPSNALALTRLGEINREGDVKLQSRVSALLFVQGFLLDPSISREFFRGGKRAELAGEVGPDSQAADAQGRLVGAGGRLNLYSRGHYDKDDGDRPNSDVKNGLLRTDATFLATPRTNAFGHLLRETTERGLPNLVQFQTDNLPATLDDRVKDNNTEGIVGVRHQLGHKQSLWAGYTHSRQKRGLINPGAGLNGDFSFSPNFVFQNIFDLVSFTSQNTTTTVQAPEVRYDIEFGSDGGGMRQMFTLGYARSEVAANSDTRGLVFSDDSPVQVTARQSIDTSILYLQMAGNMGQKLSYSAQLKRVAIAANFAQNTIAYGDTEALSNSRTASGLVPSAVINYRKSNDLSFRLFASRRVVEPFSSLLGPVDNLLTGEGDLQPRGISDVVNGDVFFYKFDVEKVTSTGVVKAFLFTTRGRNVSISFADYAGTLVEVDSNSFSTSSFFTFDRLERKGIGTRFERQLGRNLFGQMGATFSRSSADRASIFSGDEAGYTPKILANASLNYLDEHGYKAGVNLNYTGKYFADPPSPVTFNRPRYGGKTTVDLRLGREPSANQEYFVRVSNLFNTRVYVFYDLPDIGRRVTAGYIRRF